MEILTMGNIYKYNGTCYDCTSTLEAIRKELFISKDSREVEILNGVCPICGNNKVIFIKKV